MLGSDAATAKWAADKIGALLHMPPADCGEIVENILQYDDPDELKDFLCAFDEGGAEFKVRNFVEDLFDRRRLAAMNAGGAAPNSAASAPAQAAKEHVAESRGGKGGRGGGGKGGRSHAKGGDSKGDQRVPSKEKQAGAPRQVQALMMPTLARDKEDKRLMVIDGASGRHKVLTNCLNCGKIVVEEEGWGPCLFCGNPLEIPGDRGMRSKDDRGFLESVAEASAEETKYNQSFAAAKATKDRLLSYDRDAKKRTAVYDDATDWFSESANPWNSEKQRGDAIRNAAEEEKREREEKRKIHATIDLFGRTVVSTDAEVRDAQKKKNKDSFQEWTQSVDKMRAGNALDKGNGGQSGGGSQGSKDSQDLYSRLRASLHAAGRQHANKTKSGFGNEADYDEEPAQKTKERWGSNGQQRSEGGYFADSETTFVQVETKLLPVEESPYGDDKDVGMCLTMHQPWASLLVQGFKRAEGREWPTDHRGRLWIHAAAKPPDEHEIIGLESRYEALYEEAGVAVPPFPSKVGGYPTSVLLGCVDVEACLSQNEYKSVLNANPAVPREESTSGYIFWCMRPRRLAVPVKMSGDSKLWKLPRAQASVAQRGLLPVRWPVPSVEIGQALLASPKFDGSARTSASRVVSASSASKVASAETAAETATQAAAAVAGPARLDLWPVLDKPAEKLEVLDRNGVEKADRDAVILQDGFVHLIGLVPPDVQQRIVDTLRDIGVSAQGFEAEPYDGVKKSTDVERMYMGSLWNGADECYDSNRGDLPGNPAVTRIPKILLDIFAQAVSRANRELRNAQNKKRKLGAFTEGISPGVGVVNFYSDDGASMEIHQDTAERPAAQQSGCPVVGICIGSACDFSYSSDPPGGGKKPKVLQLKSGDVYLFGGASRQMWHGVPRIVPRSSPSYLNLLPGRLNVTMRAL